MKKLSTFMATVLVSIQLFAQAPQKMSYQAVIRNASNNLVTNAPVKMRISILQGSTTGTAVYSELHSATTNTNGLVSIEIGAGNSQQGTFSNINWGNGTYYLKTETDPNNGTNYTITGTSQLLSVPYALYSGNGNSNGTTNNQIMYWNGTSWVTLNPGSNGQSLSICDGLLMWTNKGVCPASITGLNCADAEYEGSLISGVENYMYCYIPYSGGNGGFYDNQTVNSTGVTGLTASRESGTLQYGEKKGDSALVYYITGIPNSSGIANFLISIGGKSCTLSIQVKSLLLDCAKASNSGTLIAGILTDQKNEVTISIPYTGGNGGTYISQSVNSIGVTGLTATLAAGTLFNGAGDLTYTITGTPSTIGTASFLLGIGGQTCMLSRTVTQNTVTDASGNTYPMIMIGRQVWMAENLRTTKYKDGSNIPVVTDNTQWENNWNNSTTLPMMCWYNNDQSTYTTNKFGALYNWYAINPATNGNKNVCPTGWHVPTDAEWTTLTTFLGGVSVAGGKMKSTGTQYWASPNEGATNSSGFSGLPGGIRIFGSFESIGYSGSWWGSTEYSSSHGWQCSLGSSNGSVNLGGTPKNYGMSVRCIKD